MLFQWANFSPIIRYRKRHLMDVTSLTGQQSVAPLTRQLRNENTPDVGLANRDTAKERITSSQEVSQRIAKSSQQPESRTASLSTSQANENQPPKGTTQRGSLVDLSV